MSSTIMSLLQTCSLPEQPESPCAPYFSPEESLRIVRERLELPLLSLHVGSSYWIEGEQARSLQTEPCLTLIAPPIAGKAYWFLGTSGVMKLLSWTLADAQEKEALSSSVLREGLYQYVALEMLDALVKAPLFSQTSPKIVRETPKEERFFAIEIVLRNGNEAVTGTWALSKEFQSSFDHHFVLWKKALPYVERYLENSVAIYLSIGQVTLPVESLAALMPGVVLLPDEMHYNLEKGRGRAKACIQNKVPFTVEIENGTAKIHSFTPSEAPMEPTEDRNNAPPSPLEDLPLTITVDLGPVELSVKELSTLSPNSSFSLPPNPGNVVVLRLQGRKIGTAELIALGEAFGLRILSMDYTKEG
ncbi:MAG: FliM/FliN family flagellar motor switch protein [Chlamydiota bacterium]